VININDKMLPYKKYERHGRKMYYIRFPGQ